MAIVGQEIFSTMLDKAERTRKAPAYTKKSLTWFRKKVKSEVGRSGNVNRRDLMQRTEQLRQHTFIGRMYHFYYDPKLKAQLPYYDRFPLVFPIEMYSDGFLGMNLHYLNPRMRAKLMDALFNTLNSKTMTEKDRLRVSYDLLNGSAQFRFFKPTVKRYLYGHVRSRFLMIPPEEWQIALFLPSQDFQKSTSQQVWKDSRKIARRG